MKQFVAKTLAGLAAASGLASTGCHNQGRYVDPCYPERYVHEAKQSVHAAFAPQVQNGDILALTVWNYHFDAGKDELTAGGRDFLDGLVRRRPSPSPRVYLATSRDLSYDPLNPEKFAENRRDLDEKRANSVQKYVTAQTAGRPMGFEIVVHDPSEVGQHASPANRAILLNHNTTSGSALTSSSATTAGQGQSGSNASSSGGGGGGSSGSK